jgi:hypothetical protein
VTQALDHRGQLAVAAAGDHGVRQDRYVIGIVEIFQPGQRAFEGPRDAGDGIVRAGVGRRHADEIFVNPGGDKLPAIRRIGQPHPVRLDANVLEPRRSGGAGEVRQVAAQRDLGPGQGQSLPLPPSGVVVQHLGKLVVRLRPQPVHGAFDHAVRAGEVALEVDRHLHVVGGHEPLRRLRYVAHADGLRPVTI